jgi:hypothetical protein
MDLSGGNKSVRQHMGFDRKQQVFEKTKVVDT